MFLRFLALVGIIACIYQMQCHAATDVKKIENYLANLEGSQEKIDVKRVERDISSGSHEHFHRGGFGGFRGFGGFSGSSSEERHRYGGFGGYGNYPYYG